MLETRAHAVHKLNGALFVLVVATTALSVLFQSHFGMIHLDDHFRGRAHAAGSSCAISPSTRTPTAVKKSVPDDQ